MIQIMLAMKRILLTLITICTVTNAFAQLTSKDSTITNWTQKDSLAIGYLQRIAQHTAPCYKLYPTDNIWTFLELETYSGRIWQVQFSTKGPDYRFKCVLNDESLLSIFDQKGGYAGRFELYKTQNMYNSILLDTETGSTWQVQWSMEKENRSVMRIL